MTDKLKGFIQSGIIFIGDPVYMSGDKRDGPIPADPTNPFKDWDAFAEGLGSQDHNLPLPGAFEPDSHGRGCAIQTGLLNGKYEVEVVRCPTSGDLSQIVIKILP
jgi:hypothetical protein